jgi:hypothetical protein
VDYQDHYSYFDSRITAYNFLRYSERGWRTYNPSLHYQNRMRHPDYMRLYESAGFEIVEDHCRVPSADDLHVIESMPLDARFSRYSSRDLGIRHSHIVLRKRSASAVQPDSGTAGRLARPSAA